MSKLFRMYAGNPTNDGAQGIVKSPEGVPVIGGMDSSKGSHLLYDLDGNVFLESSKTLFIRGKKVFEELENSNIVIADAYTLNALNIALTSIENILISGKEINVSSTNMNMFVDGTAQILAPKVILGKINSDILYGEADGEVYEDAEQLYNENSVPDPLMTKRKFSTWWGKIISKLLSDIDELKNMYNDLVDKYNNHVHIGRPPSEKVSPTDYGEASGLDFAEHTAKNVGNMQASKTTSAI